MGYYRINMRQFRVEYSIKSVSSTSHCVTTLFLNGPSKSEAIDKLVQQGAITKTQAFNCKITNISEN